MKYNYGYCRFTEIILCDRHRIKIKNKHPTSITHTDCSMYLAIVQYHNNNNVVFTQWRLSSLPPTSRKTFSVLSFSQNFFLYKENKYIVH